MDGRRRHSRSTYRDGAASRNDAGAGGANAHQPSPTGRDTEHDARVRIENRVTRIPRVVIAIGVVLATFVEARPQCPSDVPPLALPLACVGDATTGTTAFCFPPGCLGTGTILDMTPPGAPFAVTALVIDGPAGVQPVSAFPVSLAPGESIVATIGATLVAPGTVTDRLLWTVALSGDGPPSARCDIAVTAGTPDCSAPGADPCIGQTCVAGACVPSPTTGPCEDGDPCTIGDTCVAGACVPGPILDCSGDLCAVGAQCVGGACVGGTPVACDDGNPCTLDTCDPARGCVTTPLTGPPCDTGDACSAGGRCEDGVCRGSPLVCPDDGIACTDERCGPGGCEHVPVDARCGGDQCSVGACRPGDPAADARGCVVVPVSEGQACTDDGFACTDDVCTGGACLHVPIDARCGPSGSCAAASCAPDRPGHDVAGCVAGAASTDGSCAEDGDPCTDDVCRDDRCLHTPIPEAAACAPITHAFRRALGLGALARALGDAMQGATAAAAGGDSRGSMAVVLARVGRIADDFAAAADALSGGVAPASDAGTAGQTLIQKRAATASAQLRRTPQEIRTVVAIVIGPPVRSALGRDLTTTCRRRGRLLLRETKNLKAELKRLQQVTGTFAR
jgi:slime mold repeat-containing protein